MGSLSSAEPSRSPVLSSRRWREHDGPERPRGRVPLYGGWRQRDGCRKTCRGGIMHGRPKRSALPVIWLTKKIAAPEHRRHNSSRFALGPLRASLRLGVETAPLGNDRIASCLISNDDVRSAHRPDSQFSARAGSDWSPKAYQSY
jgi:hypothetical protein